MQGILAKVEEQGEKDEAFLGHPVLYTQEYIKTHKTVDPTWDELKDFFDACSAAGKTSGNFQDLPK